MAGRSGHDALHSPGWNATLMSGERLERMKACAEKANTAMPPNFTGKPFMGPESTPQGDRMLERGRWANANRNKAPRDSGSTGRPTMQELQTELGGPDGFFTLCGLHDVNLFANPRMHVLFDTRDLDTAVSAMDHGKRIASTLLDETLGTRYFSSLGRGGSGAFAVMGTHSKAKQCPMRPTSQQKQLPSGHRKANRRFTVDQRALGNLDPSAPACSDLPKVLAQHARSCSAGDTWVGSHMCAAEECGASEGFQQKYGLWLAMLVSAYAPFVVDVQTGQLDWMEETPYG
jgi:hypothetical protein